jgi:hypothetical protein
VALRSERYGSRAQEVPGRFNATRHGDHAERHRLLDELLVVVVTPTPRCEYGTPIEIGAGTFVRYNGVLLVVAPITQALVVLASNPHQCFERQPIRKAAPGQLKAAAGREQPHHAAARLGEWAADPGAPSLHSPVACQWVPLDATG